MSNTVTYNLKTPFTDMDGKPVLYLKVVPVCDKDGHGIYPGSVLENVKDKERGVVNHVYKAGDRSISGLACAGDLSIQTSRGSTRITNNYKEWRHVPHAEQTYEERYDSWLCTPFQEGLWSESKSRAEQIAIDGIMSLLPRGIVDCEYGPFADSIENALRYLADHLTELKLTTQTLAPAVAEQIPIEATRCPGEHPHAHVCEVIGRVELKCGTAHKSFSVTD